MKKQKINTNEIQLNMSAIHEKEQLPVVLSSVVCVLSVFSMCMSFCNGFGVKSEPLIIMGVGMFLAPLTHWSMINKRNMKMGLSVEFLLLVIYAIICNARLLNGITGISNHVITTINEKMAQANVKYVVQEQTLQTDEMLATLFLGAIITVLFSLFLHYKNVFICVFLLLGSSMVNMLYKGEGSLIWVTFSLVCTFIVMYFSNVKIPKNNANIINGTIFTLMFGAISVCFVLFVHYTGIQSVDDLKDEIIYHGENIVYGKSDYPEGQLKRFHVWEYDDDVRFVVRMPDTEQMHLKGYVGSKYTQKGWTNNDENVYGGDYMGMIDWFRANNFYPLTQTSMYLQYSLDNGLEEDKVQGSGIYVKNLSARKKYQYVPENLAFYNLQDMISPKQDVNFVEQDLFGEKDYWFDIYQIEENDYLNFPAQIWFDNETDGKDFIQAENVYRSFANRYYIDVPEDERALFDEIAPKCNNNVHNAIPVIREYLKNEIAYSEEVNVYNGEKNYVQQVLTEDRRGFSPQFATIATLLFRYYGIPARYVEGYYVTNEALEDEVEVMSEHAHAWVEIYIKGFGFIPVEVTPGFYIEENGGGGAANSDNDSSSGGGGTTGSSRKEDKELFDINYLQLLKYVLLVLVIVLVVALLSVFVRRIVICRQRKKKLASSNLYEAIAEAGCYMENLYEFDNQKIEKQVPTDVKCILERTRFSNHLLKREDVDRVLEHMNCVLGTTWSNQNFFGKLNMMFLKCLK